MCEGFAAKDHTVVGCGRSVEAVAELNEQFASVHRFDVVDVAGDRQVAEWAGAILDQFGAPDLLINNAALINANASLWEVPASEFSQVVDVNIKGVANVIRHFVPAMIAKQSGVIVNFSSGWGRSTAADVAPYCATKWAVEGMTQAMAQELPSGMAAVLLNPGVINTDMLQSCFGGSADSYPKAAEWARQAVPLILSFDASHNGEPMSV
ncbi:UNVERIFIED_CONTAM: hypothetical protein GTU68_033545 [Idotea baltica]|nr:hypothetical protein [Idotea baltica]